MDATCLAVALGSQIYTLVHLDRFVDPGYSVTTADVVVGTLLIVAVLEAARRTVGWGLTLTADLLPRCRPGRPTSSSGSSTGRPRPWTSMVESFFGKEEGLYGIPVGIMSSVLILFIIFAAFLSMTGIGDFFVRLATALAGRIDGRPRQGLRLLSALLGTISGSGVANVMMDGVFTIPMMKRIGYGATFAAAVEAVASIGRPTMPPIMAAAAFIPVHFVGVPFRQVAAGGDHPRDPLLLLRVRHRPLRGEAPRPAQDPARGDAESRRDAAHGTATSCCRLPPSSTSCTRASARRWRH